MNDEGWDWLLDAMCEIVLRGAAPVDARVNAALAVVEIERERRRARNADAKAAKAGKAKKHLDVT